MQESGFTPDVQPLKEFEDDYGLKPEDGEESDDEEEGDASEEE
jgi:hypothetical protein